MIRGDIYDVDFESSKGRGANKTRPAIVVSNDFSNKAANFNARGLVVVVPVSSNTERVYPFQVLVAAGRSSGLRDESKAQVEQLRAIDVGRLRKRRGVVATSEMVAIDAALRLHLAL